MASVVVCPYKQNVNLQEATACACVQSRRKPSKSTSGDHNFTVVTIISCCRPLWHTFKRKQTKTAGMSVSEQVKVCFRPAMMQQAQWKCLPCDASISNLRFNGKVLNASMCFYCRRWQEPSSSRSSLLSWDPCSSATTSASSTHRRRYKIRAFLLCLCKFDASWWCI